MEKIKSKQKTRPAAADKPAPPTDGDNCQTSEITTQTDLCIPDDDEKAKRDAGKWWKPWVSQPGGEQQDHTVSQ